MGMLVFGVSCGGGINYLENFPKNECYSLLWTPQAIQVSEFSFIFWLHPKYVCHVLTVYHSSLNKQNRKYTRKSVI